MKVDYTRLVVEKAAPASVAGARPVSSSPGGLMTKALAGFGAGAGGGAAKKSDQAVEQPAPSPALEPRTSNKDKGSERFSRIEIFLEIELYPD